MVSRVVEKYNRMSVEVKAAMWFTICGVLQKCINFITTPLFTRLLTEEQYGQVTIYNSWVSLLTVIITLNLFYGSFNTALMKFEEHRDQYISSVLSLVLCLVTCAALITICAGDYISRWINMPVSLIAVMLVQIYFEAVINMWMARNRFEYRYISVIILTAAIFVLSPLLSILIIANTQYKAEAKIIVNMLVFAVFGMGVVCRIYVKGKTFFSKIYWGYALKFNLPLVPHYLSSTILGQSDRIMIERMINVGTAAIYSVAYSMSMALSVITTAVNQAFTPWLYRKLKSKEYDTIPQTVYQLLGVAAAMLIVLMLFGPEAITILAPKSYSAAVWAVPPIAASIFFTFLYQLFANIEFYYEKSSFIMWASIGSACLNLMLNYIFISRYGFLAAAYTTLFCYAIFGFTHYFFARYIMLTIEGEWNFNVNKIIWIMLVFLMAMVLIMFLYLNDIVRYAVIFTTIMLAIIKRNLLRKIINQIAAMKK